MIQTRPVEQYLAELDDILHRYRLGLAEGGAPNALTLDQALAMLRHLGYSNGDGLRLLRGTRQN
jgi:hypothetical protein